MKILTILVSVLLVSSAYSLDKQVKIRPDRRTTIPENALIWLPHLKNEQVSHWNEFPQPYYLAALIEHESGCFGLPKMCWSPKARLKTSREEGAGFGQLTRAFRSDGSIRFDSLYDLRVTSPSLQQLNWSNIYSNPMLQLRAVVLKVKQDYRYIKSPKVTVEDAIYFTDASYNAGRGRINKDRKICASKANCDPDKYYGHVSEVCSINVRIYNRSACDIYHNHVDDTKIRSPKYIPFFEQKE
jgi:hypothetical protein